MKLAVWHKGPQTNISYVVSYTPYYDVRRKGILSVYGVISRPKTTRLICVQSQSQLQSQPQNTTTFCGERGLNKGTPFRGKVPWLPTNPLFVLSLARTVFVTGPFSRTTEGRRSGRASGVYAVRRTCVLRSDACRKVDERGRTYRAALSPCLTCSVAGPRSLVHRADNVYSVSAGRSSLADVTALSFL